ncbi:hypothetical protein H6P81_015632 [Aristolochia fimbriata]|uniref:Pectinesterase inhibitor domain-containing protein n=1 Tax=Aristolochia fimbriata TaxID=158543 RepID=A0AAV7E675_ARIFI|nr:hypothetical protein H6P81_015632 [Aristolochia fimbriata]
MASLLLLTLVSVFLLVSLLLLSPVTAGHSHSHSHSHSHVEKPHLRDAPAAKEIITMACSATRFPQTCEASLSGSNLPNSPAPLDLISAALRLSSGNLATAQSMVRTILDGAAGDKNRSTAARNCLEVLSYSGTRISLSSPAIGGGRTKDARAWVSAALLYQYDCWSALKYVNTTAKVNETMAFLLDLTALTSNALAMLLSYDVHGNDTAAWAPPRTERDGFWAGAIGAEPPARGFRGGFPATDAADATVCKEGKAKGCYDKVQDAVDAAPENLAGRRFVVYIKEGVYKEMVRVPAEKKNVVFLGDGIGKTVITGDLSVQIVGVSTYNTATVGVAGDGPEGWLPWSEDFALSTLYYGEFENTGAGASTGSRVKWSSQIPAEHVGVYSVANFIQGDEWLLSDEQ